MNDISKIQRYNDVLTLIQRVHTAFGDMYPHAGLVHVGGSRKFIRKPFLDQLKKVITNIRSILDLCDLSEYNLKVSNLWSEISALLTRLELNSTNMDDNEINSAAVTLYFASGIAWNYIVKKSQVTPVPDDKYLQIEPVPILLKMYNRLSDQVNVDLDSIIDLLMEQMSLLANRRLGGNQ